jgi:transglutaminase-like putative cysteine protease
VSALQQISRNALVWIIISLLALVAPHASRLPIWILVLYAVGVIWRLQVHRGRWSFPGRWVKVGMILSGFIGIYASYGSFVGLEPTVALLLTAFAFKLLELSHRKDAYVLLFLGYFICLTQFLFSQDLLVTLYALISVTLVTTALVAIHRPGEHQFKVGTLRVASVMLLQALPLMIVLFFLFPRFGPLWTVPIKNQTAKTGMSDFMKPGDVASLSQSADVAFRVKFDGEIPVKSALYWRGLVLSRIEQGVWSGLSFYDLPANQLRPQEVIIGGEPIRYNVIMEPTQQKWLYGLKYARSDTRTVMQASDFRLFSPTLIETEFMYTVNSWTDVPVETILSDWRRTTETQLPPTGNSKTRKLSLELREEAGSNEAFVDLVLDRFKVEPYVYTLRPGLLPEQDSIDAFLFQSQRGFCEHYASAFVFMMRAAGVPARVVAGYQGGEINPVNKTVIVHQFDAHAWAEVWLASRGWVRVDPTAAISPLRIEFGLEEAMASEGSFLSTVLMSPARYRSIPVLNLLRLRYDALTYRWQTWVVGFDSERQFNLLRSFFGETTAKAFAIVLLGSWALVLLPVAMSLFRAPDIEPVRPLAKHYRIFCKRLARLDLIRRPGETPGQFAQRVEKELPDYTEQLWQITDLYNQLAYADTQRSAGNAAQNLQHFARVISRFRPKRSSAALMSRAEL